MTHSGTEFIEGQCKLTGRPLPEFLKNKPVLDPALFWYWDSFLQLDTERLKDFGQIPWSAINRYRKEWNLYTTEEFDSFLLFIREIDKVYLEEQQKKLDRNK